MLSVIIVTKNEAHNIVACLESVAWADEIIVLDSGSSDDTVKLAVAAGVRVIETDWPGYGPQQNRGIDAATCNWIYSLDADERITPALADEIRVAIMENKFNVFDVPRRSFFVTRFMRHSGWWPDRTRRLFKKGCARFTSHEIHANLATEEAVGHLTEAMIHYSFLNYHAAVEKMNRYSSGSACDLYVRGKRGTLVSAIGHGLWSFIRTYFLKAGFLDGQPGLILAIANAEGTYYKYLKLMELQINQDSHAKLISVIVSTYNRPDALEACIKSLLQQTEQNFEILIADDGSTDGTQQLINAYSAKSSVPIVHVYQPDCGFQLSRIRNKAVAISKGNYIIFLDGDCMVRPNFVAKHRQLATPNYFVAGNRVLLGQTFTEEVLLKQQPLYLKKLPFFIGLRLRKKINRFSPILSLPLGFLRYLQPRNWRKAVGCNTAMWKNDFLVINGYDESFVGWGHEDSDLVIRLMHNGIYRKEGRFAVPVLHLWHPQNDKSKQDRNYQRLMARLEQQDFIRAEKGVSQYLE